MENSARSPPETAKRTYSLTEVVNYSRMYANFLRAMAYYSKGEIVGPSREYTIHRAMRLRGALDSIEKGMPRDLAEALRISLADRVSVRQVCDRILSSS